MGLDMYFTARRYLAEWNEEDKELKTAVDKLSSGIASEWEAKEVTYNVAYWRKANAIHVWFVKNIQNNVDDCGDYYVDPASIIKLYDTVCEVLKDHSKAADLLPPVSGFFFGSVDIDEWYYQDLEYTKKVLEPIVNRLYNEDTKRDIYQYDFYYHSSW